jgi:D-alanyl-D-alanine carboxypeptidase/D-alanyl-D-alanine-endopeptidase (penicillin-binding protein 4)
LHGTYPKNCVKANSISVLDRQDYLEHLFRTTWSQMGGSFSGAMREAAAPADSKILAAHVSRVLPEVMRDTNKQSDNTLARLLFLSLGSLEADPALGSRALPAADATTAARAEQTIRGWMQRHQIDDQGLVLENGSGLSRSERVTPTQLAGVLKAAQQSLWAPEFLTSLPIAAVDGTLKRRLKDSPAGMRARMKTGTLSGVIGLAGYVPDANNQVCIVVALINSPLTGNGVGRGILDALIDWVARSGAVAKETVKE